MVKVNKIKQVLLTIHYIVTIQVDIPHEDIIDSLNLSFRSNELYF